MKFSARLFGHALILLLCAVWSGCVPTGQSQLEEEKEPHFIEGKRAVNSMDYGGAIEEFEKAVEANPRNASAHFELGWLYEEKEPDPAAAIYHYQQFLKLHPNADTADAVKLRILNCKQDLAKAVLPLPAAPGIQHDLEQLVQSNNQLRVEVEQWRAYFKAQQTNRFNQAVTMSLSNETTQPIQPIRQIAGQTNPVSVGPGGESRVTTPRRTSSRTYTVQTGDTLAAISRKFNVKLDALAVANPGLDARRLRVGQTVNIP